MNAILHELGTLDVLVLNAAVAHSRVDATEVTLEQMEDAFDINTIAAFNLTKAYLALPMAISGKKTIIHISTAAAHMVTSMRVGYGTSKAAGVQIMQQFAQQYKDDQNVQHLLFPSWSFLHSRCCSEFWEDGCEMGRARSACTLCNVASRSGDEVFAREIRVGELGYG